MWQFIQGVSQPGKNHPTEKRKYNHDYDQNKRKREFQLGWLETRPWLTNDHEGGMKCTYCIELGMQNSFLTVCSSLKIDSIKKHEQSDGHKRAAAIALAKSKPNYNCQAAKTLQYKEVKLQLLEQY
ncbi:hypothetical protein DPMN_017118 [Dreissena polymorpha]|uniref:C17orf113 probable zinc finger domain-containing protein n=1 Tax=Dreissena polymorpha TaxID=45954 RepID=A0A9D4S637_DREPO|nr:hypothetical protein DPMN_017118 [Dreissena polymorpha]